MKTKNTLPFLLSGLAVGVGTMFLLDPLRGRYRRSVYKDKSLKFFRKSSHYFTKHMKDLRNRTLGLGARAKRFLSTEEAVPDNVIEARVRSSFGRIVSHPKSVYVRAVNGVVTLSGPVLKKEVPRLLFKVRSVNGVKDVINSLNAYESNKGISALQGAGPEYISQH